MEFEQRHTTELIALGKRIKEIRKKRKLTQVDLELRCKIDHGDISRIENGRKNLEFYTIVKLAVGLEVELFDLFAPESKVLPNQTLRT